MPKISMVAITGISQPQTIKLKGHVKKENVTILVDIGRTHNFMDINVARKLNLFVYPTVDIRVMVADGKKIDRVVKFHKVKLQIEDYELET
jgi:predicted aspartyl protease